MAGVCPPRTIVGWAASGGGVKRGAPAAVKFIDYFLDPGRQEVIARRRRFLDGLAAFGGLSAAEALGFPAIGTGLITIAPTRDFASPFLRPGILPHWLSRASCRLISALS